MKFKIVKRFSLAYLGDEWKDCYLNLKPFSVQDVKTKLPQIAKLQEDSTNVEEGVDMLIELLSEKFIDGKVVDESGTVVDMPKEAIADLPVEVIGRAFSFLSSKEEMTSLTQ